MKRIKDIVLIMVFLMAGCQQERVENKHTEHGYIDSNGYIEIERKNKHGYMNLDQEIVIPCDYKFIYPVDAYYFVGDGDEYGVVDKHNKMILPIKYGRIAYVKETHTFFARFHDKTILFDEKGVEKKTIDGALAKLKFDTHILMVDKEGKRAFINEDGEYVSEFVYDTEDWFPKIQTHQNHSYIMASKNGKAGILDEEVREVVDFEYDAIYPITHYKNVYDDSGYTGYFQATKNGKSGIIDIQGNTIIPFVYDIYDKEIEESEDNKASYRTNIGFELRKDGNPVFLDMNANVILDVTNKNVTDKRIFYDDDGFHMQLDAQTSYYDVKGDLKFTYEGYGGMMEDQMALIRQKDSYIIIDEQGKIIHKSKNSNVMRMGTRFLDGDRICDKRGKLILDAKDSHVVYIEINEIKWFALESKHMDKDKPRTTLYDVDGRKVMEINGVVSVWNENPFHYDSLSTFKEHKIKSEKGIVAAKLKKECKPIYTEIVEKDDYYCASKKNGEYVLIDKESLEVVFKTNEKISIY